MTWTAYVVDDEPLALDRLVRLLRETGRVEVAGASRSPRAARTFLSSQAIDVLFLDIQMPGMNGFELLAGLATPPCVVFCTAHDEFALRAFEVNSIDYLLKPVDPTHLKRALDKLERLRSDPNPPSDFRNIAEEVVKALKARPAECLERLASRIGDRVRFVDVNAVTHVYASDKLTYAVAAGKTHSLDVPLAELEQRLDPKRFVRIHRATLVHTRWVAEIRSGPDGQLVLRLRDENQTELTVARSRAAEVKARLGA
jgi:two-component system, LytTR family, response regulator